MFYSKKLKNFKKLKHCFFSKKNGFSKGIYSGLNCGRGSRDNKKNVRKNLELVAKKMKVEKNKLIMPPKFDLQAELDFTSKSESKAKDEISLLFGVERRMKMDFIDDQLAQYFSFDQKI